MIALIPAAFFAGILMFLAPCTLPIVPGYLTFISATPSGQLTRDNRRRLLLNSLSFVIGFSVIFIILGLFAGWIGGVLGEWRYTLSKIAGAIFILFGITMLGSFTMPVFSRELRWSLPNWLTIGRWESSLLIGMLFALGWSPCIGPILGSILFLASSSSTALSGAVLLAIFSLGLGVPFILTAILIDHAGRALQKLGTLAKWLQIFGSLMLIGLGVLMLLNLSGYLVQWSYDTFWFLHYDQLLNYL